MGVQTAGGKTIFVLEAGWIESLYYSFSCIGDLKILHSQPLLLPIAIQTKRDPRGPVLLVAFKIMLHAKLCLSVIIFLTCVCWHPERI